MPTFVTKTLRELSPDLRDFTFVICSTNLYPIYDFCWPPYFSHESSDTDYEVEYCNQNLTKTKKGSLVMIRINHNMFHFKQGHWSFMYDPLKHCPGYKSEPNGCTPPSRLNKNASSWNCTVLIPCFSGSLCLAMYRAVWIISVILSNCVLIQCKQVPH